MLRKKINKYIEYEFLRRVRIAIGAASRWTYGQGYIKNRVRGAQDVAASEDL